MDNVTLTRMHTTGEVCRYARVEETKTLATWRCVDCGDERTMPLHKRCGIEALSAEGVTNG